MKRELFMLGSAPCLSTLCLHVLTTHDQSPRPSLSVLAYHANKCWRWEWWLRYNHTGSEIWSTTNKTCQYTLLSKPICAKEERNGPPSDNQGPPVPNPRYGCVNFYPACDTAHWYSTMISTYSGTTSRHTTEIRQLVTHGWHQHLRGSTSKQHTS